MPSWAKAWLTQSITALLLKVAPVTTSISPAAMGALLPISWFRKASSWTIFTYSASVAESESCTVTPDTAPFSTVTVTCTGSIMPWADSSKVPSWAAGSAAGSAAGAAPA